MKNIILSFSTILLLTSAAAAHDSEVDLGVLAQSKVTLGLVASLEMGEQNSTNQLWAARASVADDDILAHLLEVSVEKKASVGEYDCHFHSHDGHDEAHCHGPLTTPALLTAPGSLTFGTDDFVTALASAVDIFSRKIAVASSLTQARIWQQDDEMFVTLSHDVGQGEKQSFFMCHIHGPAIDCHRSLQPGPAEPTF